MDNGYSQLGSVSVFLISYGYGLYNIGEIGEAWAIVDIQIFFKHKYIADTMW